MNIISFSGPRGAGKDAVMKALLEKLNQKYSGMVSIAVPVTDRALRPGELEGKDIITKTPQEFTEMADKSGILFVKTIEDSPNGIPYRNGVSPEQIRPDGVTLLNISQKNIEQLKHLVTETNGKLFSIFLYTNKETRKARVGGRESILFLEMVDSSLEHEPAIDLNEINKNYSFSLENLEGQLQTTVEKIFREIEPFVTDVIYKPN